MLGQYFGCKGATKFADVQEKSHFSAIFLVQGIRCRGEEYKSTVSGNESTFLGRDTTFSGTHSTFLGLNLKKSAFLVIRSSFGVPSVVSRSSLGKTRQGIREVKETAILIKSTFLLKSNDRFGITRHGVWSFVQFFSKKC